MCIYVSGSGHNSKSISSKYLNRLSRRDIFRNRSRKALGIGLYISLSKVGSQLGGGFTNTYSVTILGFMTN